LLSIYKNFKRVVVDTFVYHKFCKFHGVLAWVLQISPWRLVLDGKPHHQHRMQFKRFSKDELLS
jgi:hypothetical protein